MAFCIPASGRFSVFLINRQEFFQDRFCFLWLFDRKCQPQRVKVQFFYLIFFTRKSVRNAVINDIITVFCFFGDVFSPWITTAFYRKFTVIAVFQISRLIFSCTSEKILPYTLRGKLSGI